MGSGRAETHGSKLNTRKSKSSSRRPLLVGKQQLLPSLPCIVLTDSGICLQILVSALKRLINKSDNFKIRMAKMSMDLKTLTLKKNKKWLPGIEDICLGNVIQERAKVE